MLRFAVTAERHDALRSFLARAIPFYEQPGGIRVRLLQCADAPDEFVEMVEYRDEDAYERDQVRVREDPTMRSLLAEWRELHAGPLRVELYREAGVARPR
jgi:hypothetical protein